MTRDIVAYYNGLTKAEYWSLEGGDVQNLLEEAIEKIEELNPKIDALQGQVRRLYWALVEAGVPHALVFAIASGGQPEGPNLEGLRSVLEEANIHPSGTREV